MRYLPTDAALFITNETDRLLLAKQQQHLFPVIEWFKDDLKLELGVMIQSMAARINHPPEVVQKLEEMVKRMVRNTIAPKSTIVVQRWKTYSLLPYRTPFRLLVCKERC